LLLSGDPVSIAIPGNPTLNFTGSRTIWHLVASQEVADKATAFLQSLGIVLERYCEEQSDEQKHIRQGLLGSVNEIFSG
jgi:hypothetical protein